MVSKYTHQERLCGALYEFRKVVVDDITNSIFGDIRYDPNPKVEVAWDEDEELEVMLELVVEVEMKREVKKREKNCKGKLI